jgi:hypothetical protein
MTQAQAPFPVLYRSATPLNRQTHARLKIKPLKQPLAFARPTHLLPALFEEFTQAGREIPIVFVPDGAMVTPVFVLGLKQGINSFITADGLWRGNYLPAYIRRYPFIMANVPDGPPLLCVDDSFEGLNEADGKPLFKDDGEPTEELTNALGFAEGFRVAVERTEAFVKTLQRLDLLKDVSMDIRLRTGETVTMNGFKVVDEEKFGKLGDADFLELRNAGYIAPIYAHLLSLGAIQAMA